MRTNATDNLVLPRGKEPVFLNKSGRPVCVWHHAQSMSHARIIARNLMARGLEIVDIVKGTKTHVLNQYPGMRQLAK